MAHNLYAQLPEDAIKAYHDLDRQADMDIQTIDGYGYSMPPSIGVKFIRSSDWLPRHLTEAVWQEFTPEQAKMYADCLSALCTKYVQKQDDNWTEMDLKRIHEVVGWLNYWGDRGVAVEGGP